MLFVSRKKCLAKCGNWTSMYVFYVYYFLRILEIQSLLQIRIIERVLTGISTFLATSKFSWGLLLWVYQSNSFYVIAIVHWKQYHVFCVLATVGNDSLLCIYNQFLLLSYFFHDKFHNIFLSLQEIYEGDTFINWWKNFKS